MPICHLQALQRAPVTPCCASCAGSMVRIQRCERPKCVASVPCYRCEDAREEKFRAHVGLCHSRRRFHLKRVVLQQFCSELGALYLSTRNPRKKKCFDAGKIAQVSSVRSVGFHRPVGWSRSISTVGSVSPTGQPGRYRRSVRLHLRRITVDIDGRFGS